MEIKFKKLRANVPPPIKATLGAAGYDLTAMWIEHDPENPNCGIIRYKTGLAIEIPPGYVGLLFPRSSSYKYGVHLSNSVGVIDSDYRGEVCFAYKSVPKWLGSRYAVGDRIGQLVIIKHEDVTFKEVEELPSTERGKGGFGSTGK